MSDFLKSFFFFFNLSIHRSIMETMSSKHMPSPSSPDHVLVSPETLSHHSSEPRHQTVSTRSHHHHVTINESKLPLSVSSHQQLVAALSTPSTATPILHNSSSPGTAATVPSHLALLYHTSSHHHHLHPILSVARRPSRQPETIYVTRPKEIRA